MKADSGSLHCSSHDHMIICSTYSTAHIVIVKFHCLSRTSAFSAIFCTAERWAWMQLSRRPAPLLSQRLTEPPSPDSPAAPTGPGPGPGPALPEEDEDEAAGGAPSEQYTSSGQQEEGEANAELGPAEGRGHCSRKPPVTAAATECSR